MEMDQPAKQQNASCFVLLEFSQFAGPKEPVRLVFWIRKPMLKIKPETIARINRLVKILHELNPAIAYDESNFITKLPRGHYKCEMIMPPVSSDKEIAVSVTALSVIIERFFGLKVVPHHSRNGENASETAESRLTEETTA